MSVKSETVNKYKTTPTLHEKIPILDAKGSDFCDSLALSILCYFLLIIIIIKIINYLRFAEIGASLNQCLEKRASMHGQYCYCVSSKYFVFPLH